VTFSFHTKGGEIYWEFLGRGERYGATLLQKATGYPIKTLRGSAGGYKDWCIDKLHIPAYTIECGSENLTHPIKNIKKLKKCYKALKYFTENYGK
jgi:g-D-glutamyl-meso-diaminopimelate peptidase